MHIIEFKSLLHSLLISLGVGTLSSLLTRNSMETYKSLNQPFLSPPGHIFPLVWTILFVLMGISSYIIFKTNSSEKYNALIIYGIQLIVNFCWPLLFFNSQKFLLSFFDIIILLVLIVLMIIKFYKINKISAFLQTPYFLWVLFAGYLNLMIYFLNK